jgi:DNA polymerase III subunit gamma/tau
MRTLFPYTTLFRSDAIHTALDSGSDPRLLARQLVDYLRALLLIQMGNISQVDLAADTRQQAEKHARAFAALDVLRMIKSFNVAATDLRGGWQPSLPLELALAEMMEMPAAAPVTKAPAEKPPVAGKPGKPDGESKMLYQNANTPAGKMADKPAGKGIDKPVEKTAAHKEAEEPAEKPAVQASSGISLDQVAKVWKQVCATIKQQNPSLNALLNSARLLEVKDGVLMLGFQSELLRSKADTPEQIKITCTSLADALGAEMPIRCVVTNAKHAAPPNVKADGMVAAALKHGGEIVDTQE